MSAKYYAIKDFKDLNVPENMVITQHSRKRFTERGISIHDVCMAIETGEIIEQYSEDFPFPSCLILGTSNGKVIHVVASIDDGIIYIITAYIPNPEKWENDWRTRKEIRS
ncbi:DUF4258 domain-containing protein [Butyrivibrio sp. AC2005]|uniref:DUF4258 domain-containing protein n=1 Tax=Butyrivibrio sp. AC2005 TaxID=1280672 RepID=UPI000404ABA3|nr:DUF4258 domain-containing protein [Butyrivibrio sp. AC2005]